MEPTTLLPFPVVSSDPLERDLVEIEAGIALISTGMATRVRIVGLARPETVAAVALALAQAAGATLTLDRGTTGVIAVTLARAG